MIKAQDYRAKNKGKAKDRVKARRLKIRSGPDLTISSIMAKASAGF